MHRRGFALVVALVLMGFILLLLISLATLLQVESGALQVSQKQVQARENARMGLLTALAHLQQSAGPDRRISARGDIRLDASGGARFWTGIWQSEAPGLGDFAISDSDFQLWLVSMSDTNGNAVLLDTADAVDTNLLAGAWEAAALVGPGSAPPGDEVSVGLVALRTPAGIIDGAFGWWVADEGIKAKVTLADPYAAAPVSTPDWLKRVSAAQRMGVEVVHRDEAQTQVIGQQAVFQDEGQRFLRLGDMGDRLTDGNEFIHNRFHDLTTFGYGLPVDVREGRLRRDLTAAFSHDAVFNAYFGGGNFAFFRGDDSFEQMLATPSPILNFTGPNWGILRDYYRLYRHINPDHSIASREGTANVSSPFQAYRENYQAGNPLTAIDSRRQLTFSVRFEPVGPAEVVDDIRIERFLPVIQVRPITVLYNPHNVFLEYPGGTIEITANPRFDIRAGENPEVRFHLYEILPPHWNNHAAGTFFGFRLRTLVEDPVRMEPGESLIWSLKNGGYLFDDPYGGTAWRSNVALFPMVNETNIFAAFELPVHAAYVAEATSPGANNYGGPGNWAELPSSFGLTTAERDNLIVERRTDVLSGEVEEDSFELRIVFSDFGTHYQNPRNQGTAQRYINEFGVGSRGLDDAAGTGIDFQLFPEFSQIEIQPSLATWRYGFRVISDIDEPVRFIDANFRPQALRASWEDDATSLLSATLPVSNFGENKGRVSGSEWEMPGDWIDESQPYRAYWGDAIDGSSGVTHVTFFDVPRQPLLSLGALQHAAVGRYGFHPNYIIGQSYAPPMLPRDQPWSRAHLLHLDLPYLMNQTLWDGYFFSGIPQDLSQDELDALLSQTETLPNSRHILAGDGADVPGDYRYDPAMDDPTTVFEMVASRLMVDGAFNINSTSVQAWRALLAASNDFELPVYNRATGSLQTTEDGSGPIFPRMSHSFGDSDDLFNGARRLSPEQVDDLADAIVDQVRLRGPFGSVSAFINRKLADSSDPLSASGALQAAIDLVSSINQAAEDASEARPLGSYGGRFAPTPHGPQAAGLPGYLLQSDLLQVIGPVLSARSDTFLIRSYGDVRDPLTGSVIARAWCEAVVQRIHTPVDRTGDDVIAPEGELGRRFVITDFRWLSEDEI